MHALLERQKELEETCMAEGARRFRTKVENATKHGVATREGAARSLLAHAIEPIQKGIEEMVNHTGRGAKHCSIKWLKLVGPDVAAYMTAKVILDGIGKRQSFGKVALGITSLILDELRWRRFQQTAPELFEYRMSKFNTTSYVHMSRSLSAVMSHEEIDVSDLDMPPTQRMLVGTKLIEIAELTTGLFETTSHKVPGRSARARVKSEMYLAPTQATIDWVTKRNGALEVLMPIALPMVVPPLPWGPQQKGGYRFALLGKYPLVRGITSSHAKALAQGEMPAVYAAVNAMQNTPWRVNTRILDVVETLMAGRGDVAGLPSTSEKELPPKAVEFTRNEKALKAWRLEAKEARKAGRPVPEKSPEVEAAEAALKLWRRAAHKVHEENYETKVARLSTDKVLGVARLVRDEASIYFPYNCDFRGRVYPVSNYLNPQGDDLCKGLLTFANGKPLGTEGAVYLALHGANCMDTAPDGTKLSKLSRQERVDWVVENTVAIVAAADDPLTNMWWTKAEDPFQFLAFCFEWAGYARRRTENGHGEDYECSLPVAMDGTCNGLQHFSAMFRDHVGGRAVNLVPSEKPNDIYYDVSETVEKRLIEMAEGGNGLAKLWIDSGLVNRKLCKRPTMTFGYGSKKFGFVFQLKDYLRGLSNWNEIKALFRDPQDGKSLVGPMCRLMASLIWEALGWNVVAAFDGMAWMQKAASCVVANGTPVRWVVPGTGFQVRQEYFVSNRKKINTMLAGRVVQPSVYIPTEEIIPHKQRNAIAPNVIHSLDAAALMLTVNHCASQGVESFGMVHDSYATVPGDAAILAQATRQCFVSLYTQQDVAAELHRQWTVQAKPDAEMPVPPAHGTLDLGLVLVSDYFFS